MASQTSQESTQHVFLSIVSHELKTPITSIQGFTQAMQRKIDQKIAIYEPNPLFTEAELRKHQEHLEMVMRQIKRLTRLIDDLLDVSVIESGRLGFDWTTIDLASLLSDLSVRMQLFSADHTIQIQPNETGAYQVIADESRLEKLFSNLLVNAIKYSPQGSTITVNLIEEADFYLVSVKDEGVGIPLDDQQHVFDLYYRGKEIDRKKYSGLGLGLYLSKQIVDLHRGKIYFESVPGHGSTFYVELPKVQEG
ncbi:MAG: HAMP domain-containing histidine kinase [bacterium]|nr:HAMP domain-containing histidine kinase [bacterium]